MNLLAPEIKLHLLHLASHSLPSLFSLSQTSSSFHALFTEHVNSLLKPTLNTFTETEYSIILTIACLPTLETNDSTRLHWVRTSPPSSFSAPFVRRLQKHCHNNDTAVLERAAALAALAVRYTSKVLAALEDGQVDSKFVIPCMLLMVLMRRLHYYYASREMEARFISGDPLDYQKLEVAGAEWLKEYKHTLEGALPGLCEAQSWAVRKLQWVCEEELYHMSGGFVCSHESFWNGVGLFL